MIYLHIPMNVYDANVIGNAYVTGLPGMSALAGFAHVIERQIIDIVSDADEVINVSGMQILHQVNNVEFTNRDVRYQYNDREDANKPCSINDKRMAHIFQSIILQLQLDEDAEDEFLDWFNDYAFENAYKRFRFAGGSISLNPDRCKVFYTIKETMNDLPRGYNSMIVEDKTYLINDKKLENEDALDTLIRLIARKTGHVETESKEDYMGYLVPIAKGYTAVEKPKDRNARGNYPHAFAEPVIGIARLRSVSSFMYHYLNETDEHMPCFWQYPMNSIDNNGLIIKSKTL